MLNIFDIPSIFNLKKYLEIRYLIRKPGKTNILVLVTSAIIIYVVYPYLGLPGTSNAFYYFIFRPMIIILELAIYIT